jgi:selenocysteine-specific elongation factor
LIIATAGHVDHGKTSLVKALTGVDTDRLPEEKRRGMTIDLGFAYQQRDSFRTIGFVDVPGHERFVHNMLAGLAGIDGALLVIAADDGPMPQTREHLAILDLLGLGKGAVALTKIDRVDSDRVACVTEEIRLLLAATSLAQAPIFPLSCLTLEGLPKLDAHLQYLCSQQPDRTDISAGRFRMTVDRSFTVAGVGLVVTGTVIAGQVATGDEVRVLLAGVNARARSVHAQNRVVSRAVAGERCALNLAGNGLSSDNVVRGDWVVNPSVIAPVDRIDIKVRILGSETQALRHWTSVHVHIGAANVTGRLALLESSKIAPGETGLAQLVLHRPVGACHSDVVILRDQSGHRTVAGGRVIDLFPPARGRARPARIAYLNAIAQPEPGPALDQALRASPSGLNLLHFAGGRNLNDAEMRTLISHHPMLHVSADAGFHPAHWDAAQAAALRVVSDWHIRDPQSPGVPEDRLLEGTRLMLDRAAISALAAQMIARGLLIREGAALRLPKHDSRLNSVDQALWEHIQGILLKSGVRPPTATEITATGWEPARRVKDLLIRMAKQRSAWRISEDRFALPLTVGIWADHIGALAGADRQRRFTAAEFRDRSGVGRNLSIEILEFFDRIKVTRRIGDLRLLQQAFSELQASLTNCKHH